MLENPSAYRGQVVEVEGQIPGLARDSDGGATLMLATTSFGTLTLKMSRVPTWLQPGALVRALCIVTDIPDNETVIGIPEMEVIAVASAADIQALEARWRQERAIQEARRRPTPTLTPRAPQPTVSRGNVAARSSSSVTLGTPQLNDLSAGARAVFPAYRNYIKRHNKRLTERQADDITYAILRFSEEWDMDPRLIVATVIAESDFRVQETSHAGAMGLIQLMPDEVRRLKLTNPYDPVQNIAGGVFLLKERLNKYSRSGKFENASLEHIILTLASYNAGEGAVRRYKGVPPYRETRGYIKRIMRLYQELTAGDPKA